MAITLDELHRLVRRLANQMPVRYYLDASGDGSYTHVALELWFAEDEEFPHRLNAELEAAGLFYEGHHIWKSRHYTRTWRGERKDVAYLPGEVFRAATTPRERKDSSANTTSE